MGGIEFLGVVAGLGVGALCVFYLCVAASSWVARTGRHGTWVDRPAAEVRAQTRRTEVRGRVVKGVLVDKVRLDVRSDVE